MSKYTTKSFIIKAMEKHGNTYNYKNVEYVSSKEKIIITCPIHGDFKQVPHAHLGGQGCPKCGTVKSAKAQVKTTRAFIDEAINIHGDKYDYSKSEYVNAKTKVIITCKVHGDFEQTPRTHTSGGGCYHCGRESVGKKLKTSLAEFTSKASIVHNNYYSYDKTQSTINKIKTTITCPIHGDFKQTPGNHLRGQGCKKCSVDASQLRQLLPKETFIDRCSKLHNNKYTYEDLSYTNLHNHIEIICPIHGMFRQEANAHIRGSGCPQCAKTGFDKANPAILYYLKINGGQAYKIGITNRSVEERFNNSELQQIEILATRYYEIGKEAYDAEQQVLNDYKEFKYVGPDLLASGNTELFNKDILMLDNNNLL